MYCKCFQCVSPMRVSIWCGHLITSRLVWLMNRVAAKIDSRARWAVDACVYAWLRLKSNTGNQSWSPALNHSEPEANGTRQLLRLQRRCLIAIQKMTFNQLPEDFVNLLQEKEKWTMKKLGTLKMGSLFRLSKNLLTVSVWLISCLSSLYTFDLCKVKSYQKMAF